jgi:hypothetical protein
MADGKGKLGMLFAYPEVEDQFPGSPLQTGVAPRNQSWDVHLTIRYRFKEPVPDIPNLCGDVLGQPQVQVWEQRGPNVELTTATLRVGQELILKTMGKSELLIA